MIETEWNSCADAGAMLAFLWQQQGASIYPVETRFGGDMRSPSASHGRGADVDRALHRFYLASCRGIWALLPQEASRRGVEMAEQFLAGTVSAAALTEFNYHVEGAAFCIDYNTDPIGIDRWVAEVRALPAAELRRILHPPEVADEIETRELLKRAAYFADYAMLYSSLTPKGPPPTNYRIFLSADVLREYVGYPGQTSGEEN